MTQLLINFIDFVIELALFIVPETLLIDDMLSHLGTYMEYGVNILKAVNFLVPVPLIFAAVSLMVLCRISNLIIFVVDWIIRRVFDVIP